MAKILACICQPDDAIADASTVFDSSSIVRSLFSKPLAEGVEVKLLANAELDDLRKALDDFKPTLLYMAGPVAYNQSTKCGSLQAFKFKGQAADLDLGDVLKDKGVDTLYMDCKWDFEKAQALQRTSIVNNVIAWEMADDIPAKVSTQFVHSFFTAFLTYAPSPSEAFVFSSHIVQSYFTCKDGESYVVPELPQFLSEQEPCLPDNSSIPPIGEVPGVDLSAGVANVPGWSDIRLLAPRAELRLLLCGGSDLIESAKLSYMGEAMRALLVMEMRSVKLLTTTPSVKVPANLPDGCSALRCEVKTGSGRSATIILGGQPEMLKDNTLVQYALRMTLVSDSLSLQFRLPPPGVDIAVPRSSPVIAGGAQVVDTVCLTSVWAVQVLRSLSQ
eukprot:gene459-1865_t